MSEVTKTTVLLSCLLAVACGEPDEVEVDEDDDGWVLDDDCDDGDPDVHPGATELCDGVDNDCDGVVDDGEDIIDGSTWYADADGDGYGDPRLTRSACSQPEGYLAEGGDCDDGDGTTHPGATELCDGVDNDCDGEVDEGLAETVTWYRDADHDGYGSDDDTVESCLEVEGYVAEGGDCNDGDASLGPHVDEVCDGVDNDCDGETDEGDATDASTWYADGDGDGHGDPEGAITACTQPPDTSVDATDCDDSDGAINPDALEACDGVDNDCDGATDESGATGETTFYLDFDGDGFGDGEATILACSAPAGYAEDAGDCDDGEGSIHPGAVEICINDVDEDCDGVDDDGCTVEHCGSITASETWESRFLHHVTCDVYVHGSTSPELTVEDGAVVTFDGDTGLYAGWSGTGLITVDGSVAGVVFTSSAATPAPEEWSGLFLGSYASSSTLTGLTVSHAGGGTADGAVTVSGSAPTLTGCTIRLSGTNGLYVTTGGAPTVTGSTFEDNTDDGVYLEETAALARDGAPTFTDNVLTGNVAAMTLPANSADMLDPSSTFTGNDTAGVFLHGDSIEQDSTWLDLDEPYVVTGDVQVSWSTSPVLTIADGVEVRFEGGTRLDAGWAGSGSLVVEGSSSGVTFTSAAPTPAPGDWHGLFIGSWGTTSELTGLTVAFGGGAPLGATGGIHLATAAPTLVGCAVRSSASHGLYGQSSAAPAISGSTFSDNARDGVALVGSGLARGAAPSFSDNVLTGNGEHGISIAADFVGELDGTSTFTGNTVAGVRVLGSSVLVDATWQALDVPYWVTGNVSVNGASSPLLTVAAGAVLEFEADTRLDAGWAGSGSLRAVGTAADPILFTSAAAAPAAGDWYGVRLGSSCADGSVVFDHVTIEYGGGSPSVANITFDGCDGSIDNSVLRHSGDWGLHCLAGALPTIGALTYADNTTGDEMCVH